MLVRGHVDGNGDAPRIRLDWRESGGPPVQPDAVKGFGTKLIERSCNLRTGRGKRNFGFEPAGLEVGIAFPME